MLMLLGPTATLTLPSFRFMDMVGLTLSAISPNLLKLILEVGECMRSMLGAGNVVTNSPRVAGVLGLFVASDMFGAMTLKLGAVASIFESKDFNLLPALRNNDGLVL
jgi:hypothetical protein